MRTTIAIEGGPLTGERFDAEFGVGVPTRLIGRDIHRSLIGTYELISLIEDGRERLATYRLRMDMDYMRLVRARVRRQVEQQKGRLSE
jgi:hypothetical protein